MKQTAVEWLYAELVNHIDMPLNHREEILEQAKAMEKEQIMDAWDALNYGDTRRKIIIYSSAEQYYNETFKSE